FQLLSTYLLLSWARFGHAVLCETPFVSFPVLVAVLNRCMCETAISMKFNCQSACARREYKHLTSAQVKNKHQHRSTLPTIGLSSLRDELRNFGHNVLGVRRNPLEDGNITVSRALGSINYPAGVMLVAAMNPCMCKTANSIKKG